jgi:hypothetical protein
MNKPRVQLIYKITNHYEYVYSYFEIALNKKNWIFPIESFEYDKWGDKEKQTSIHDHATLMRIFGEKRIKLYIKYICLKERRKKKFV